MSASIYLITNTVNGKTYIGQTVNGLKVRWRQHCKHSRYKADTLLARAIRKYGPDAFTIELLEETIPEYLNDREIYWVAELKPAYNMTAGGEGGSPTDEVRMKLRNAKLGKPLTAEHRAKMSEAHRGNKNANYGKYGSNSPNYGKKHSPETLAKMSAARKAYYEKKRKLTHHDFPMPN